MKTTPSVSRRKFSSEWDEIGYLRDRLLYWLYDRANPKAALRYVRRLRPLLLKADPDCNAILGEECRSLICEVEGDLEEAIRRRENEIRLIQRLQAESKGKSYEAIALKGYGDVDLSDRLDLLAILYHASGNLDKAISTLMESRELCKRRRIKFDAADLLEEYQNENGE